jgi:hypothetical protein
LRETTRERERERRERERKRKNERKKKEGERKGENTLRFLFERTTGRWEIKREG